MKIKFEIDIGANEVMRLNNAQAKDTRTYPTPHDTPRRGFSRDFKDLLASMKARRTAPTPGEDMDLYRKARDELREFTRAHGLPDPEELRARIDALFDTPTPSRKPAQGGNGKLGYALDQGDVGAVLYALEKTIPELMAIDKASGYQ